MAQLILAGLGLIALKLVWDVYKDYQTKRDTNPKKGQVIDLSEAWIDMNNLPYKRRNTLLSRQELALFHLLNNIIHHQDYTIFPKVRLEDIIVSEPNINNAEEYLHRLKERSADFLICSLPDLKPELIVISEGTSDTKMKQLSDKFNKRASEEAGYPVIVVNTSSLPHESELTSRLKEFGVG
ncbi:MAG TPA: DUF2726 domain-containing protein [Syntrophomonadaceae bacterium]|nr:DUF2726 domain-containing protein [Syntrophomonadaceae bacterium]